MQALVLSLYIGYALYSLFPFTDSILKGNTDAARTILSIVIYLVFVGLSVYLLRRLGFSSRARKNTHTIILALLSLGFLLALGYQFFAINRIITLSPEVAIFFTPVYFFWWFIAPIVGLFILTF